MDANGPQNAAPVPPGERVAAGSLGTGVWSSPQPSPACHGWQGVQQRPRQWRLFCAVGVSAARQGLDEPSSSPS